jgi:regulator of replication initiation timing
LDDKEKRISKLEGELAAAQLEAKKVPGLEAQAAKVPRLEATIGGLQAELAALRAQLAAAEEEANKAEESLRICREENDSLRKENDRLRAALNDCERKKAELEAAAAAAAARRLPPPPPSVVVPPPAKAPPKLRKSTLKLIADDINELGPICFYVFFKTYLYDGFKGSSITETSYDTNGQIVAKERTLARVYYTKEFINKLYPKIFFKVRHQRLPREKEQDYSEEWKNTVLWFMFHLIRRIGELYLDIKGVKVPKDLVEPAIKINFDSVDKTEIKDYIIILFNELCAFLGIVDAASIRSNLLKKSDNLMISLRSTVQSLYDNLKPSKLTTAELILYGIENTCMRGLFRQLKEEAEEEAARLGGGGGGGGGPRRPQIGGGRRTSVKSLSQGMLLLFLVELRKSKQLKSAKEVQGLVNKAGKALDSIGQYELVLTILQEIVGNINIHTEEGYTYVKLNDLKEEKANALVESYNHVFSKSDSKMFKTLGTAGSFHASAPEEFEEVLGKGPFCLVLDEGKSKEETPLHGVSDEYQVVLEEKERKVLEDNGGIPLGGVIFLYLVCLNELYCDSSDEECIRPTI